MKVEIAELNGIINSTIFHLNGHTLALHDKTI